MRLLCELALLVALVACFLTRSAYAEHKHAGKDAGTHTKKKHKKGGANDDNDDTTPTMAPTAKPTKSPHHPFAGAIDKPTHLPTISISYDSTTMKPTHLPPESTTGEPTISPTHVPKPGEPTAAPTKLPTHLPSSAYPSPLPTSTEMIPTLSLAPTFEPSHSGPTPTTAPTSAPSDSVSFNSKLFNLSSDPYEMNDEEANDDYSDIKDFLVDRVEYWFNQSVNPSEPNITDRYSAWEACSGVCPWLSDSDGYTEIVVNRSTYSYAKAPHVILFLVDDWGWNDVGYHSTYMSWTTPTIDLLASTGIKLENHYAHESCVPSRGALLTGRYSLRLGLTSSSTEAELPLTETTIGQEFQTAGYRTHMVGKWDMGLSTQGHLPKNRGFDSFYGFYSPYVDYYNKTYEGYYDLQDGSVLVTNEAESDTSLHNAYLMQTKAEDVITTHVSDYPDTPLFFLYSLQLIHYPYEAPQRFLDRCQYPASPHDDTTQTDEYNYCAMNLMLDEVVTNITCLLKEQDIYDDTLIVIMSDNGGAKFIDGNNYPYRGSKGDLYRGGVKSTAIVHGSKVPTNKQGTSYSGQMHITDWLPTLMGIATGEQWTGSYTGAELDGVDMWSSIVTDGASKHTEIVHSCHTSADVCSVQWDEYRIQYGTPKSPDFSTPDFHFTEDLAPSESYAQCTLSSSDLAEDPTSYESASGSSHKTYASVGVGSGTFLAPWAGVFAFLSVSVVTGTIVYISIRRRIEKRKEAQRYHEQEQHRGLLF